LGAEKTFRVKLDAWGFRLPDMAAKAAVLSELDFVTFQGRVDLSPRADSSFWAILVGDGGGGGGGNGDGSDGGNDAEPSGQQQQHEQQHQGQQQPWRYIYFGREVALAQSRTLPSVFSLKQRRFLGPTSMDAEMAFVMNNIVRLRARAAGLWLVSGRGKGKRSRMLLLHLRKAALISTPRLQHPNKTKIKTKGRRAARVGRV
jgi:hypothetical protein